VIGAERKGWAPSQIGGQHRVDNVERGVICAKRRMPSVERGVLRARCKTLECCARSNPRVTQGASEERGEIRKPHKGQASNTEQSVCGAEFEVLSTEQSMHGTGAQSGCVRSNP